VASVFLTTLVVGVGAMLVVGASVLYTRRFCFVLFSSGIRHDQ
jgi:hypothetical protein